MSTNLPIRRRNLKVEIVKQPKEDKKNDLADKLFSTFATVAVTAVFYFTGWVYLSHWYSYYGMDVSQINIPLQVILLYGLPGMLILIIISVIGLTTAALFSAGTGRLGKPRYDFLDTFVFAYFAGVIIVIILLLILRRQLPIPVEVWIALAGVIFLRIITHMYTSIEKGEYETKKRIMSRKRKSQFTIEVRTREEISGNRGVLVENELEYIDNFLTDLQESKKIVFGIVIIFYLFVSISVSAILGDWDATRGASILNGNWRIPKVSLYSTARIKSLASPKYETISTTTVTVNNITTSTNEYEYGSLGLLASTDKVYYLVDLKTSDYYTSKPNVYVIPRTDSLILNMKVSPYTLPTVKPTPLPTLMISPTSTSTSTATNIPTP